jgi:holo-[acyl-carrier protein] synthase
MRVYGIGVDLVETERIRGSVERFGERFLQRIFVESEVAYCRAMKDPALHLAARFAAKEALSKAFRTGIGSRIGWRDLEIVRQPPGPPSVMLHGGAKLLADQLGVIDVQVSLSHTRIAAAASAIIICQ